MSDHWESEAENWIAWARTPGHDSYWLFRDAFFALVPEPGEATLEIGCGEGRVARDLAARGHHVTGVDLAPTMVAAAQAADPSARYQVSDACALPFEGESFDAVVAFNSLMDIDDMPGALREAGRVLRPGGRLCVCVLHPMTDCGEFTQRAADAPFVIAGSYLEDRRPWYSGRTAARAGLQMTFVSWRYPLEAYARALEDAGLLIEVLREPPVPQDEVERDPAEDRWRRLPCFLMLRAVRFPRCGEGGARPAAQS